MTKTTIPEYTEGTRFSRGFKLFQDPLGFTMKQTDVLGDFFKMRFMFANVFVTSNIEAMKHVLQRNQKNYRKSPAYKQLKIALGEGLLISEGDFWRRQRRMAQPAFYKAQLKEIFEKMTSVGDRFCENLAQKEGKGAFNVAEEMMGVTADMVLEGLFTSAREQAKQEMLYAMKMGQKHIIYRISNPLRIPLSYVNGRHTKFQEQLQLFDKTILDIIEKRRTMDNPPTDLLTMLMQTEDENGERMSDKHLRDEAMTIYAAGHETTSNAMSWMLYLLAQHPEVVDKLRMEIEEVLGERNPTFGELRALQYTKQVIEETMRQYPPAYGMGRQAMKDDEILGHHIPAKSIISISIYALHHNPEYYPNPTVFNPDNFAPDKVKARPKLAYMPFGAGPRMCIGNHFAMMEMQLLLVQLIRRFDFELIADQKIDFQPLITLSPKNGILMKVRSRT